MDTNTRSTTLARYATAASTTTVAMTRALALRERMIKKTKTNNKRSKT